jgi:hypothetical protein
MTVVCGARLAASPRPVLVRGIAFHQSRDVPVRPASHGCVRVTVHDARWLYRLTPVGTKVRVIQRSRPPRPQG